MARYRVTMPPGAPVPGVGFFDPGQEFTAPEGYAPSKTMEPLDEAAQAALAAIGVEKPIAGEIPAAKPKDQAQTLAELGGLAKGKRVADRKV